MSLFEVHENVILSQLGSLGLSAVCRSCLKIKLEMNSLFASKNFICTLNHIKFDAVEFLNSYVGLEIEEDDGLPNSMCTDCVTSLIKTYDFVKHCEKADSILRKFTVKSLGADEEKVNLHADLLTNEGISNYAIPGSCKLLNKGSKKKGESFRIQSIRKKKKRNFNDDDADCSLSDSYDNIPLHHLSNIHQNVPSESVNNEIERSRANEELVQRIKVETNIDFPSVGEVSERGTKKKTPFQCHTCNNTFTTIRGLRLHNRVHSSSSGLVCGACGRHFDDAQTLRNHRLSHAGDKPYKCSYCERKFAQKKPLQYHEKTHTGERPHVCDMCGKSYIQPNNLVIHRRIHTGEKPFVCKECGKAFTNGASLTLHMPVHTGVKDFVCTICGKRMARSGELTIHMRTHSGEKPYVCRTCSKAFIKKSSLQAHMYSHTGEKKFVCPICGHRVAHAGKLTVHIRTHSSAKPFACPICDRRFANQGYLKQHSKIHSGVRTKPFVCSHCGRGFVKNRNLTEHLRTHTGERPFICLVCNHGFAQRSTLNFHMKSAHGEPKDVLDTSNQIPILRDIRDKTEPKDDGMPEMDRNTRALRVDSDPLEKHTRKLVSPLPLPVLHTKEFSPFKLENSFIPPCDLKAGLDHRGPYDPRLLGFAHYPLQH